MRSARCGVRGSRYEVRGARCGPKVLRVSARNSASFLVALTYLWPVLAATAAVHVATLAAAVAAAPLPSSFVPLAMESNHVTVNAAASPDWPHSAELALVDQ